MTKAQRNRTIPNFIVGTRHGLTTKQLQTGEYPKATQQSYCSSALCVQVQVVVPMIIQVATQPNLNLKLPAGGICDSLWAPNSESDSHWQVSLAGPGRTTVLKNLNWVIGGLRRTLGVRGARGWSVYISRYTSISMKVRRRAHVLETPSPSRRQKDSELLRPGPLVVVGLWSPDPPGVKYSESTRPES